jgi:hypothetical protein
LRNHLKRTDWPSITSLAMAMSALRAAGLRGRQVDASVMQGLFKFVHEDLPEHERLQGLLVFRSMLGRDAELPLAVSCYEEIRSRYARLSASAKPARLLHWTKMDWWTPEIGQFQGHELPVRIWALEGMLAVLKPRLSAQDQQCQRECLSPLLARLLPEPGETLAPVLWQPGINAWVSAAANLAPDILAVLMREVLFQALQGKAQDWVAPCLMWLDVLKRCLEPMADEPAKAAIQGLANGFAVLTPRVLALCRDHPRQAVDVADVLLAFLQPIASPWAKMMHDDLDRIRKVALKAASLPEDN